MIPANGRTGALGAMMDEYERALGELAGIVAALTQADFDQLRDAATEDEDCRSIRSVVNHVVRSGHGYIRYMRGSQAVPLGFQGVPFGTPKEALGQLRWLAARTAMNFEGDWDMPAAAQEAVRITSNWGPVFNLEQMFEHAIVHVLRHRRQIERFLRGPAGLGGQAQSGHDGTTMPLYSVRQTIRPFTLEDAPFILRLLNEPSYLAHIPDKGVRTLDQARQYLSQGPLASYATHGHGLWMVQDRETGVPMGMCGLVKREPLAEADLGYAFLPEYWGKGLAREAGAACLEYARTSLGMSGVLAIVSPDNPSSSRMLLDLGFIRTGQMEITPGDLVDVYRIAFS